MPFFFRFILFSYFAHIFSSYPLNSNEHSLWSPAPQTRRSSPLPASNVSTENSAKQHRKTAPMQKANTIGIPSEADLSNTSDNKHGSHKTKLNLFGFRNTLRSKHKSETLIDSNKEEDKNEIHRRWCENNQATVNIF